jgi:DNA helicase-2/ATP-dependent DNA helicase PcrA
MRDAPSADASGAPALNEAQARAVTHGAGPLLILAGAGTGKTRVITHRIAHLVREGGVDPASIVAMTFTNRAAREMRERTEGLIGARAQALQMGTFHSICARWLRSLAPRVGLRPSFSIYDDDDQLALIRVVAEAQNLPHDQAAARSYRQRIDQARNEGLRTHDVATRARGREGELFARLFAAWEEALLRANACDFGALIQHMVTILEDDDALRTRWQARFPWVLVDEFQDTNVAQYRLLAALCPRDGNVTVVGDDDQSIYRWRGASVENVRRFHDDFQATTVALELNYRSRPVILQAAHEVVRHLPQRMDKSLRASRPEAGPLQVCVCTDDREEAEFVARELLRVRTDEGLAWRDCAVFYRTNAQSRSLEEQLRALSIPHEVVGGTSFYERREIRDVLAWLRIATNPDDDVALRRIVQAPPRGIGTGTLREWDVLREQHRLPSLRAVVARQAGSTGARGGKKKQGATVAFDALLQTLETLVHQGEPAALVLDAVLRETGYETWLATSEPLEAEDRQRNLDELRAAAEDHDRAHPGSGVPGLLENLALRAHETPEASEAAAAAGAVTLMTVHAAKGLEFPAVWVTGLEEEVFPLMRRGQTTDAELEEERRLCYVALTRAMDRLTLTAAMRRRLYGQTRWMDPSRFLLELQPLSPTVVPASVSDRLDWRSSGRSATPARTPPDAFSQVAPVIRRRGGAAQPDAEWDQRPAHERGGGSDPVVPEQGIVFDDSHFPAESVAHARRFVGRRARHNSFGVGTVVDADPTGTHVRLTIDFPGVGERRVVLRYVELLD